jgi:NADP-reducing hydrogenase subunit HndB
MVMAELKSIEALDTLRRQIQQGQRRRQETGTIISVGMGTCGIAAGARETLLAIEQELARLKIEAHVRQVGCIGVCVQEPLVDIQQAGGSRIYYGNILPERVPQLIEEHLVKGQPVRQWVIGRIPGE